jgi:hypothetical protein
VQKLSLFNGMAFVFPLLTPVNHEPLFAASVSSVFFCKILRAFAAFSPEKIGAVTN